MGTPSPLLPFFAFSRDWSSDVCPLQSPPSTHCFFAVSVNSTRTYSFSLVSSLFSLLFCKPQRDGLFFSPFFLFFFVKLIEPSSPPAAPGGDSRWLQFGFANLYSSSVWICRRLCLPHYPRQTAPPSLYFPLP